MYPKILFKLIIILQFFLTDIAFPQRQYQWFPPELNVQSFNAKFLEPKNGFLYDINNKNFRLDIGSFLDILHITNSDYKISIGSAFSTFTRLRSEKHFRFPVETIDYLFGLNTAISKKYSDKEYGIRLSLLHLSAHLVDGQFDNLKNSWRDNRLPQVYSREFIELLPYIKFNNSRFYFGLTYLLHTIPKEFKTTLFHFGGEYFFKDFGYNNLYPYISYDFLLSGVKKYLGNNYINFGVKFGHLNKKGIKIYYSYISGKSLHGQYFHLYEKYSSIGFTLGI